ncbi:MAG: hypothetical protein PW788_02425 [Micavibrio sp.]|nr:hypothetical protein [Micavibrio sp.]
MDRYYKASDQVLTTERQFNLRGAHDDYARLFTYVFDFEFKTLTVLTNSEYRDLRGEKATTMPFSQVDEDVLAAMHAKLIDLGGNPSPLRAAPDLKPSLLAPAGGIRPLRKDGP